MEKYTTVKGKLTKRLMKVLSSRNHYCQNYIEYCSNYAIRIIEEDLYYDEKSERYYNIDEGDDIEIPGRLTKTGNPETIDISDLTDFGLVTQTNMRRE